MKKGILLVSTLLCFTLSCSKEGLLPKEGSSLSKGHSYVVSSKDIADILYRDMAPSRTTDTNSFEIQPYCQEESDTLLFIVNFKNGGWRIYSSDKRTPAIIAEGEKGYFSFEDGSPAVLSWIDCMASDIARVRRASDKDLLFTEEEISANKNYWSSPKSVTFQGDTIPIIPLIPSGHWEERISSTTEECGRVNHLTPMWDQGSPYNECCPNSVNLPGEKALAGCVPLAGSQVLLYLHDTLGVPAYMVSDYYCNGYIGGYSRAFYNATTTSWSNMSYEYTSSAATVLPEAIMIGYVGDLVDVSYSEIGTNLFSYAWPPNLKSSVFEYYGISCSSGWYDESVVKTCLLSQMPVIVSASNLLIPTDFDIHCFVIDGFRLTRTKYTHYHYYVYDSPPPGVPLPEPPDYTTYTYSSPTLSNIKINWGWASQWGSDPINDGWYTLTGSWTVTNGGTYDYNHYRYMIYGFSVS